MATCSKGRCNNPAQLLCICQDQESTICEEHLSDHLRREGRHEIIPIEKTPIEDSKTILLEKLTQDINILSSTKINLTVLKKNYTKVFKVIQDTESFIEEKIEQISKLLQAIQQQNYTTNSFVRQNFKIYMFIPADKLSRIVSNWNLPHIVIPDLPSCLFSPNTYSEFIDKVTLPSIKFNLRTQFEIQAPLSEDISKDEKKSTMYKYTSGKMNNEEVSIKMYDHSDDIMAQINNHEKYSKGKSTYLNLVTKFKKENKVYIVTEPWTHTLWNEIITRSMSRYYFNINQIKMTFWKLLNEFEKVDILVKITPNIMHVTEGDWKIWFPASVRDNDKEFLYCAYEIGNSIDYDNCSLCNLYSIALVILEMATLTDTSKFYKSGFQNNLKEAIMSVKDEILRKSLIGALIPSPKERQNYANSIKCIISG